MDQNQTKKTHPPTPPMLINEISRLFHDRMRAYELDGVMSQDSARLIMHALHHRDGCSQLELVHQTHLKPPTVSIVLQKLEAEGLVERLRDEDDQRVCRVFLSEHGKEHNKSVAGRLFALNALLMQGFSEAESEQLLHYLMRMRENILPVYKKTIPPTPEKI